MARKEKHSESGAKPAWLITLADLMTLLMTFFVLLTSMSVIDERSKLVVLESISSSFGAAVPDSFIRFPGNAANRAGTGVMNEADMLSIKNLLRDDLGDDLNFQENRYIQILSINADVLYEPGKPELSERGMRLLDRIMPQLLRIRYPLLIAGHTTERRDEEGRDYVVDFDKTRVDSTWGLSLARGHGVYRHLLEAGVATERLSLEAFGQYRPRFTNTTPEGRHLNRRVDIVLDKRNAPEILDLERAREDRQKPPPTFFFRDFKFDLGNTPGGRGSL